MKLLWNYNIQTDHQLRHNKPDIIIYDKVRKSVKIIDIAIPNDANIANKISEKIQNYTDLAVELKVLWNLREVSIVPVIISATGLIHKNLKDDINEIGIILNIREMQKTALLGTARIVRSFFTIAN